MYIYVFVTVVLFVLRGLSKPVFCMMENVSGSTQLQVNDTDHRGIKALSTRQSLHCRRRRKECRGLNDMYKMAATPAIQRRVSGYPAIDRANFYSVLRVAPHSRIICAKLVFEWLSVNIRKPWKNLETLACQNIESKPLNKATMRCLG